MSDSLEIQVVGVMHGSIGMELLRNYVQGNTLALGSVCFLEVINLIPGTLMTSSGSSYDSFSNLYVGLRRDQAPVYSVDGCLELNRKGPPFLDDVPQFPQKEFREFIFEQPLKEFLSLNLALTPQVIRIARLQHIISRLRDNLIARQVIELRQDRYTEVVVGATHLPGVVGTIKQLCPESNTTYTFITHRFYKALGDWTMSNIDIVGTASDTEVIAKRAIASTLIRAQVYEPGGLLASLLSSIKAPTYYAGEEIEVTDEKVDEVIEFIFGKRYLRRRNTPWLVIFDLLRKK